MIRFADLIGQELASTVLRRSVVEDRVTHAYVFTGPEGVGKLTTALAFTAVLNCESPDESGDSCGVCQSCRLIGELQHPDVTIISPSGAQTKIDQMRELRHMAQFSPVKGKKKVIIIEQADTMNDDAASCILKTLEEPPSFMVIILLSRNPALLLQTIRSRCTLVRFSHVNTDLLTGVLKDRFGADDEKAEFLASYSDGRPGAAISLMGDEEFQSRREQVLELASSIATSNLGYALKLSEQLQNLASANKEKGITQRAAMRSVLDSLVLWYRDLLSLSVRGDSAQLINADIHDKLSVLAVNPGKLSAAIETLIWARKAIEGNANIQLISDVTMIRLMR